MNRRSFLTSLASAAIATRAAACRRADSVVLYSSVDDYLLAGVAKAFESDKGITLKVLGDTEATKTTGLVHRLIAERTRPRADVWWSNEPFGTIRLAQESLLEPFTSAAEADVPGGWPAWLRAKDKSWYGHALRARCMARNTARVGADRAPAALRELADPAWKGRIGMARPQFGTTRGHMAAMLDLCGEVPFTGWLRGMKANQVRLLDGNSAVVRALRMGEIDVGLTDTDDVLAVEGKGWPVAMCPLRRDDGPAPADALCEPGDMPIAATVARVKGGPNPANASALIDYLLSEKVERMLLASPARLQPVREALKQGSAQAAAYATIDFERVGQRADAAMRLCREILG